MPFIGETESLTAGTETARQSADESDFYAIEALIFGGT
jgi:hypothetical protein